MMRAANLDSFKRVVRAAPPENCSASNSNSRLELNVVFTTHAGTRAALVATTAWQSCLDARIVLWYAFGVPHAFPLDSPPVSPAFTEQRLTGLALNCCADREIEIQICHCRGERECLGSIIRSGSIILLGGRKRWWRTNEEGLTRFFDSRGYRALFIPIQENVSDSPLAATRTRS
jgi:hypothetical protein